MRRHPRWSPQWESNPRPALTKGGLDLRAMEADRWLRGRASPLVLRRRAPNEAGGECRNRTDRVWFAGPDSAPADSPWSERLESNQPTLVPQTSGPPRAFAQICGAGGDRTRIAALPARSPPVGRQPHSWSRRGSNSHLYVANVASSRWTTTPFAGRLGIEPSEHGFGDRAPPRGRPIRALDEATSTGRERGPVLKGCGGNEQTDAQSRRRGASAP